MEDLTKKLKVGDTVYMPLQIVSVNNGLNFHTISAQTSGGNEFGFSADGRYSSHSRMPDLLLSVSQYPKVMEVSDDGEDWRKRVVVFRNLSGVFALDSITEIDGANFNTYMNTWKFAREIQPEKERVKLTIQDIADKIGVDAGLIDIIKG